MQVVVYMLALPRLRSGWVGKVLTGEVQYPNYCQLVNRCEITPEMEREVWGAIRLLASDAKPPRTPSRANCRFCPITARDCPDRVEIEPECDGDAYDLF